MNTNIQIESSPLYMRIMPQFGIRLSKKYLKKIPKPIKILDIGCGNHSPLKFHTYFGKEIKYVCIDKQIYNLDDNDFNLMDGFFIIDLEKDKIEDFIKDKFDLIYFSHVIEHLNNGYDILMQLRGLQNSGGILYIETPSPDSLKFPHKMNSTLNFYDDPTHKKIYPLPDIISTLEKNGYKIIKYGYRRDYRRILISPFGILISAIFKKEIDGVLLWDIKGFANFVIAIAK